MEDLEDTVSPWSNTSVPRNDGTDLWKSTLSGQHLAAKPKPSSPCHTSQNTTYYKQCGEFDYNSGSAGGRSGGAPLTSNGAVGARDNLWNAEQWNAPYKGKS